MRKKGEAIPELGLKGTHIVRAGVPDTCECHQCFGDNPMYNRSEIQISHGL